MSPILKGTHYNLHPAPSSLCVSICLVFCSVTQPIPRGIILSREQLCSHVGCTCSNTQHRAGFSGAYALWGRVQQISGWELDKPASQSCLPTPIQPPTLRNKHTVQSIHGPVEQVSLCVHTIILDYSGKRKLQKSYGSKRSFSLQLSIQHFPMPVPLDWLQLHLQIHLN